MESGELLRPNPERLSVWAHWREDIRCVFDRDPAARTTWEVLTTYPGVHAVLMHRITHALWRHGWAYTARFLAFLTRILTNIDMHPGATIGRRLFIDHGIGVVIGETAEIGNDVTLYHGVTLGGTSWSKGRRHPCLHDGVLVGAGAKILGPITLGANVRVGANSVVLKDVPPDCSVVGIPGKIVRRQQNETLTGGMIDLDHHLIPDPVGHAIRCLLERINHLEKEVRELRHQEVPLKLEKKNRKEKKDKVPCEVCEAVDICICED